MVYGVSPDIRFQVLPTDYLAAIAVDAERWEAPSTARRPAWSGRRVWTLLKDTEERAYWRLFAFNGEREIVQEQAQTTALVAAAVAGASFCSSDEMEGYVCEQLVALRDRALDADEHDRIIIATRELWAIATPAVVHQVTTARSALQERAA